MTERRDVMKYRP